MRVTGVSLYSGSLLSPRQPAHQSQGLCLVSAISLHGVVTGEITSTESWEGSGGGRGFYSFQKEWGNLEHLQSSSAE